MDLHVQIEKSPLDKLQKFCRNSQADQSESNLDKWPFPTSVT